METQEIKDAITGILARNQAELEFEFVPFSQSRNKDEKHESFNYRVTLKRAGKSVFTTDYSMGIAHSPNYKQRCTNRKQSHDMAEIISAEIEHGYEFSMAPWGIKPHKKALILPDLASVVGCLATDSYVLDAGSFEDWCSDLGFDSDSIKAKGIYDACIQTALQMRQVFGDDLPELMELSYEL